MTQATGALLIGLGLVNILARDLIWQLTVLRNRLAGTASERTPVWDTWIPLRGAIFLIAGIVVVVLN
jgi:uncharacterized membrane protein